MGPESCYNEIFGPSIIHQSVSCGRISWFTCAVFVMVITRDREGVQSDTVGVVPSVPCKSNKERSVAKDESGPGFRTQCTAGGMKMNVEGRILPSRRHRSPSNLFPKHQHWFHELKHSSKTCHQIKLSCSATKVFFIGQDKGGRKLRIEFTAWQLFPTKVLARIHRVCRDLVSYLHQRYLMTSEYILMWRWMW